MLFSDIKGQKEIKQHLIHSVKNGHVAHAQMFYGQEGSPNYAMALAYATYLNCENPGDEDSCGTCSSCEKMRRLVHPDLYMVYPSTTVPASKEYEPIRNEVIKSFREFATTSKGYLDFQQWTEKLEVGNKQCLIHVREGRSIIKNLSLKAFEGQYKVVLVWLSEMMNIECANAILKVLEEPPNKTIFLLVTNDVEKNITTIISRTQIVKVPRHNDEEIKAFLSEQYSLEEAQLDKLVALSDGSILKSRELINNSQNEEQEFFKTWMRAAFTRDYNALYQHTERFQKLKKQDQKNVFIYGLYILRNLILFHYSANDLMKVPDSEKQFVEGFSKVISAESVEKFTTVFNDAIYHLERNAHPKIMFMDISLQVGMLFNRTKK